MKKNKAADLDKIDIRIIKALFRDGRMTKLQLSEEVGLSATPCWERMKKLEKKGVIKGYHAELNLEKMINFSSSYVEIKLTNYSLAKAIEFERQVREMPEIVQCEALLGDVDYVLRILSRDVDEYQKSIEYLLANPKLEIEHKTLPISKVVKDGTHINVEKITNKFISD